MGAFVPAAEAYRSSERARTSNNVRNRQERDAALQRANDRRERLITVLAEQNVFAGAGGFASSDGSARRIRNVTYRDYRRDQLTDDVNTQRTITANNRNTREFRRASLINAVVQTGQNAIRVAGAG